MRPAERRASVFILDGARPDVFSYLVDRGDLPHISRWVLEPGGVTPATTVFPSTTGVAYLPLLTGCYPGTCDVPGIRWLDRRTYGHWWRDRDQIRNYCGYQGGLINRDVPVALQSLFDFEQDSVALCTPFTRGLGPGRLRARASRLVWGGLAHYTGAYLLLDRWVARSLPRVAREQPRLTFVVFPGIDGTTHFHDPWHPEVVRAYRQVDAAIGHYAAKGGLAGDHLTVLASDHGMSRIDWHADISLALEARGLKVLRHPILWRPNPVIATAISGNASAQVYLRPGLRRPAPWQMDEIAAGEVPGIPRDLVSFLIGLEGVALLAGRDGADVVVQDRAGRARLVALDGGHIRYLPETADVLHLGPRAQTLPDRLWLGASYHGPYPDAPTQLLQLFRSPRAGDLVLTATPGADLRREWEIPEHRSGHGGLTADHMRCLVATSRPLAGPIRSVDLFPLVLEHLGYEAPSAIDGVSPTAPAVAREVA